MGAWIKLLLALPSLYSALRKLWELWGEVLAQVEAVKKAKEMEAATAKAAETKDTSEIEAAFRPKP